jgi:hypothetical protein
MPSETRRHQLYHELRGLLTKESVDELMESLPPMGGASLATKDDVAALREQVDALGTALRSDLGGDIALLRGEMHTEMSLLRKDLITWMIGIMVAFTGVMVAMLALLR